MKLFLNLAFVVMLSACASLDTQTKRIEASCAATSTAIKALAAARTAGKLNAGQIASVDKAIAVTSPICNPGTTTPPTLDAVKEAAFQQAINELQSRAAALGN